MIRAATADDVPGILRVYAQYIGTSVTYEYDLPDEEGFLRRMESCADYPFLVCDDSGVRGYAYAHGHMPYAGFGWDAELTVYVDGDSTCRGIGRSLYSAAICILRLQGYRTVYAAVTASNEGSLAFHRALGFRDAGLHRRTGYKNGEWHDTVWLDLPINEYTADPSPVVPFGDLPEDEVAGILERHSRIRGPMR